MPRAAAFAVFALGHFLSTFVRSANAVIAGDLRADVGLDASQLGLMTSLYFLAFAAAQLPFGSALDRYGARVTTPALMVVAAAGAFVFAAGDSFAVLATGRTLMGLGTAGILMGGLKALAGWFTPRRFALASGALVAIGSSGALLAATPLAHLAAAFGWRAVFVAGGAALLASALAILTWGRAAPGHDPRGAPRQGSFADVFRGASFWRIAGLAVASTGSMFAIQSLWAGPYLAEGVGLGPVATGNVLLALGVGASAGYLVLGAVGERLGVERTLVGGTLVFVAAQVVLSTLPAAGGGLLAATFAILGLTGAASALLFTAVRARFPLALTGRAVTAVNLFMFAGGFVIQWGLGVWLDATAFGHGSLFVPTAVVGVGALLAFAPELRAARARRAARG